MLDETPGFFSSKRVSINLTKQKQTGTYFSSETGELQKKKKPQICFIQEVDIEGKQLKEPAHTFKLRCLLMLNPNAAWANQFASPHLAWTTIKQGQHYCRNVD